MWIPWHTNTEGTDMADKLAKQDADIHFIAPELFFGVAEHHINKQL